MSDKKKYNYKISNLRALAILVVVFGHSIIIFDRSWNYYSALYSSAFLETLKHVINLFQMPLFVFISGYCFYYSKRRIADGNYTEFIISKAKRLLIPFVTFALLWMIPIRLLSQYPFWKGLSLSEIILQVFTGKDSGHLWFCPALFLMMMIAGLIEKHVLGKRDLSSTEVIALFGFLYLLSAGSRFIPGGTLFLNDVSKYMVWFYLGYYLNKRNKVKSKYAVLGFAVALTLFGIHVSGLLNDIFAIRILVEYTGTTLFVISLYYLITSKSNRLIEGISKNSFGIYLFHSPLIYIVFCYFSYLRPAAVIAINFFLLMSLAYILTVLMRKTRIGRLAIGE